MKRKDDDGDQVILGLKGSCREARSPAESRARAGEDEMHP